MIFRRRKFFNSKCCDRAEQFCEAPCAGQSCSAGCRVKCGFFSSLCPAVSCGVANPAQCTGGSGGGSTSSCDSGYTLAGSRCYKLVTSSSNYLQVWILTWIVVIIGMIMSGCAGVWEDGSQSGHSQQSGGAGRGVQSDWIIRSMDWSHRLPQRGNILLGGRDSGELHQLQIWPAQQW